LPKVTPKPTNVAPQKTQATTANAAPHAAHEKAVAGKGGGPIVVVRGPDNQPVPGAIVEARTATRALPPRPTNAQGEAALDPVPASEGTITGTARHPRFADRAKFECAPDAGRVDVKFSSSTAASGFLVGAIHDARGRAPVSAQLTVIDPSSTETVLDSSGFALYDPSGHFRVELAPGSYTVKASADGFVASDFAYPNVVAGQDCTCSDLILEGACAIVGHVTLPPDLQAQRDPVTIQFDLECVRGTVDNPNTTITHTPMPVDSTGAFQLTNLQPGMYRVRATDGGQRIGAWVAAKLDEGTQATVTLALTGGGQVSPLRGVVRDSRGGIVAGATVMTKLVSVTTDAGGNFELDGLDSGPQEVDVQMAGYARFAQTINIPAAGQPGLPNQVFTINQYGSAAGKVTRRGAPAPGVSVSVVEKVEGGAVKPFGPTTTDATGAWEIDNLDLGTYYLKVGANANTFDSSGAPTFTVTAGDVTQVGSVEAP
jgi:hypothetical protein